jgi:GTP-binding protein
MFIDKVKITLKAGDGGDGVVSFRKEMFVPNGGPDGGDGGNGGSIIFKVSPHKNNLSDYYYTKKFFAEAGEKGGKNKKFGKYGKDLILYVPQGTVIKEAKEGKVIADLFESSDEVVLLKGGNGGRGNTKFKTSVRQAPMFSETGEKTQEYEVILELKTIADVGLIGFPNVGKSTILSKITRANPKIANYHFTTLSPNLGVANYHGKSFVVADIPGLIEGASEGIGLGHDFLRHIERTRMLVHVVDIAGLEGRDPVDDFKKINQELERYSKHLAKLPQIVVLNKMDLLFDDFSNVENFKKAYENEYEIVELSAVSYQGLEHLQERIVKKLETLPSIQRSKVEVFDFDKKDKTSFEVVVVEDGVFEVVGGLIDEMIRGVVLSDYYSFSYFQKRLQTEGIIDKLKEKGLKEGDLVRIKEIEFEYQE